MISQKVYVRVNAKFFEDGRIIPKSLIWEDGRKFEIDRVLDITQAANLKAGGLGIRYACVSCGKQFYLYREDTRWFMERKEQKK